MCIRDSIITPVLNISRGVVLKGNVNIHGGHKKDPRKIVEESYGLVRELDKKGIQ